MIWDLCHVQMLTSKLSRLTFERIGCRSLERKEEIEREMLVVCELLSHAGLSHWSVETLRGRGF
jgi:hypothetical protein